VTSPSPSPLPPFEAPGPGTWEQDPVHFPRPATRYFQEMHPAPFRKGTSEFARNYGMLIDGLAISYINGFAYNAVQPAPPEEIPARFARAAEALETKFWRQQLKDWDETQKPSNIARHRAIQAIDPAALSDQALADYLTECRDHHAAMITQHMRHTASAVLPTGDFLAHVGQWTGLPPSELLGLMRGSAPVSHGGSEQRERLLKALSGDPAARQLLESEGDPGERLAALRALPGEAGAAINDYLDLVGNRLLDGFDICEPRALELPDALIRALRSAVEGEPIEAGDVADRIAEVRAQVPAEHQAQFDELLGEARLLYRLRDERGVYSDIWASGLMRRAVLAAGERLVAKGKLDTAEQLIDASVDEMQALVLGTGGPSAAELQARADYRAEHSAKEAPPHVGDAPQPPPDLSQLPPPVARVMTATFIALGQLFGSSEAEHTEDVIYGLAASKGVYEGRARRIAGPQEFDRIVQGDILVTESTTEAFNILLPLLGAIVTDNGGLLSHAAIVAREYGIPGVVGTREATERISDGMRIRVDGEAGEVTVLA
jgi:phosphohistidine swiveling domain-containing protein